MIRSKTGVSVNEMGDQYILLGPYKEYHARYMYESCVCHWHKQFFRQEIEEEDFPQYHPLGQAVDSQRETHGYRIHCGRYSCGLYFNIFEKKLHRVQVAGGRKPTGDFVRH